MKNKPSSWPEFQFYPKYSPMPEFLNGVVDVFTNNKSKISTESSHRLSSNEILSYLKSDLTNMGFRVENSKLAKDKISIPVLFGKNGGQEKSFEVDAYEPTTHTVFEVEAGQAVINHRFLKDFFEAQIMIGVDYLVIAVRIVYRKNHDFNTINKFFDVFYQSKRLQSPLKGLLIIGY